MNKVKLFSGYFIVDNLIYHNQEAINKLKEMVNNRDPYLTISKLNGSFRYVIESDSQICFGIDHFGGYSLFYKTSPSLQVMINPVDYADVSDIQDEQLCSLLASGFCYGQNTLYKDIKECLPGFFYNYDKKSKQLNSINWFNIDFSKQRLREKDELSDIFLNLIPKNFKTSTLALTGGIDSRLLLSLLRKNNTDYQTITYGTKDNPDIKLVEQIAKASQVEHKNIKLDKMNLEPYFAGKKLSNFFAAGFLGRSLPFECDWVVSDLISNSTSWITTGFTSFWLRPPYQDSIPVSNKSQLMKKLLDSQCRQTLISSSSFREILEGNITKSMSHFSTNCFDTNYDRWNIENRQHKYIINTSNNYRFNQIEVFMPLFDRRIMHFLNNTSRDQRLEQKIFMESIISDIFTGNEAYLKQIPSTNPKFTNQLKNQKPRVNKWRNKLLRLDHNNLNRIIRRPNNPMYQIIQSVLMQSPNYLSLKVEQAFPKINNTISLLFDLNLKNSANHLNWLKNKRVAQLNLLGIEILGFIVESFDQLTSSPK